MAKLHPRGRYLRRAVGVGQGGLSGSRFRPAIWCIPGGFIVTIAQAQPTDLSGIDVLSNRMYADGVPHGLLAQLRAERPIHFQQIPDERLYDQAWVLTRHDHVIEASIDTEHFVNGQGLNLRASYSDDEERHLLNVDDPEHLRLRRMVNKGFTPRMVRRYTEHYHDLAGQLLDEGIGDTPSGGSVTFDAVDSLSVPLPLLAICELLGTTPDDRDQLIAWSNAIITNDDPDYSPSEAERDRGLEELGDYIRALLQDRLDTPRDDLASVLAAHIVQGDLTTDEYGGYVSLLFVAGNETTRNAISHALLQLAGNPEQYELLRTGDHWDTAVEEAIRWASPVIYMSRTVTTDVDFHGHRFREGDKVVLHYASANRDESVFADAQRFDVTRDPNPHVAFGFGAHFCLGAHLARLEARCLLEQLVRRVDVISLDEPESYVRSSFISGIKRLPVTLTVK